MGATQRTHTNDVLNSIRWSTKAFGIMLEDAHAGQVDTRVENTSALAASLLSQKFVI